MGDLLQPAHVLILIVIAAMLLGILLLLYLVYRWRASIRAPLTQSAGQPRQGAAFATDVRYCTQCGSVMSIEDMYCRMCGKRA